MATKILRNGMGITTQQRTPSQVVERFQDGLRSQFEVAMAKTDLFNPISWTAIDPDTGDEWELRLEEDDEHGD